jgi:hypothetical protein
VMRYVVAVSEVVEVEVRSDMNEDLGDMPY